MAGFARSCGAARATRELKKKRVEVPDFGCATMVEARGDDGSVGIEEDLAVMLRVGSGVTVPAGALNITVDCVDDAAEHLLKDLFNERGFDRSGPARSSENHTLVFVWAHPRRDSLRV